MSDGKPARGSDQFALRFPDGMRDKLKAAAADNNRSMNAEIVARLEWTFGSGNYQVLSPELFAESFEDKRAKALELKNDELFDLTRRQHDTIVMQAETMDSLRKTMGKQSEVIVSFPTKIENLFKGVISVDEWALKRKLSREEAIGRLAEIALILERETLEIQSSWHDNGDKVTDALIATVTEAGKVSGNSKEMVDSAVAAVNVFVDAWQDIGMKLAPVFDAADILGKPGDFKRLYKRAQTEIKKIKQQSAKRLDKS